MSKDAIEDDIFETPFEQKTYRLPLCQNVTFKSVEIKNMASISENDDCKDVQLQLANREYINTLAGEGVSDKLLYVIFERNGNKDCKRWRYILKSDEGELFLTSAQEAAAVDQFIEIMKTLVESNCTTNILERVLNTSFRWASHPRRDILRKKFRAVNEEDIAKFGKKKKPQIHVHHREEISSLVGQIKEKRLLQRSNENNDLRSENNNQISVDFIPDLICLMKKCLEEMVAVSECEHLVEFHNKKCDFSLV